ncbi:MAG: magnesium transporter CorA family protein [bacterium]|nr:magnesium transporter CorA family protein [bacterium]MDZ4284231.1 magnesium transporter CorA family protein [Patescibacteria group bacterium]
MITFYYRTLKESRLAALPEFRVGAWVYVEAPTQDELDRLSRELGLDRGLLTDALDPFEVPRVEHDEGVVYVFTRVPDSDGDETVTVPLLIAVGEQFVLTVSGRTLHLLERILSGKIDVFTTQKTKVLLQILFELMHSYQSSLTAINRRVRATSVSLARVSSDDIRQFVVFEITLNDFLDALVPTGALLRNIGTGKFFGLFEDDRELMDDLVLATGQGIELCRASLKTITNIRGGYSAIVTNDLNRVIKLLTALTIVLMIPNLVASLYGMNVALPLGESRGAFWIIMLVIAFVSAGALGLFARNRWL